MVRISKILFPFLNIVILIFSCSYSNKVNEDLLKNGISVITKEIPSSRVVSILMMVKAGSINETERTQGISRLVEHSLFRVSKNYKDIQWEIDSYGGKYKSATSRDYIYFSVTFGNKFLSQVLKIFVDVIQESYFPDSLVIKNKKELLRKLNDEKSNPRLQLLRLFLKNAFQLHPYRFLPNGSLYTVRKFETSDVWEYYENLFIPENITIVIVGGFFRKQALSILEMSLNSFNRVPKEKYKWMPEPDQTIPREDNQFHSFDRNIAFLTVGWKAPSIRNRDTYSMDVLLSTLGIGESSRLNTQIRDRMSSVYFIWAEYVTPREAGYFIINSVCDPSVVEEVKIKILKEIEILRKDSITPKELKRAKMYLESQEAYSREGTMENAFYLGFWSIVENFQFAETYLPNIRSVSMSEVKRTASDYLKDNNYTSIVLIPPS